MRLVKALLVQPLHHPVQRLQILVVHGGEHWSRPGHATGAGSGVSAAAECGAFRPGS